MKTIRLIFASLLMACFSWPLASKADDIDIYSGLGVDAGVPNVLLVLDNAADFSSNADGASCVIDGTATYMSGTVGGIEQCALYNVVKALGTNSDGSAKINLGMMVYNANNITDINNANCGGSDGGCLMVPLTAMTNANKTTFLNWVKTWRTSSSDPGFLIKAAGGTTAATMQEAWAYYTGGTGLSGRTYSAIKPTAGCQKNFVIFIGNSYSSSGKPGDGGSASPKAALENAPGVTAVQKAIITSTLSTSCGSYTFPDSSSHENGGFYADEWARYMKATDVFNSLDGTQNIVTYTIGVLGNSCQAKYAALLTSMANVGGGKYFPTTDYNGLVTALLQILNEVQAVNSAFSSSSLPVSVNTQGTYLNQVFMGMFRPDATGAPRWVGNLKQYQFILDSGTGMLKLGDQTGKSAISSSGTGFLSPNAISYWTTKTAAAPDSTGGFWINNPMGTDANGNPNPYDSPDGEVVEKGGTAQQLRLANLTNDYAASPSSPRKLYTYCPSGTSCNAHLTDSSNVFATTNGALTASVLGGSAPITISSITRSGNVATATTASAHSYVAGQSVTITGASPGDYNGTVAILGTPAPTSNTFSYTLLGGETPPLSATGTFTATKIQNAVTIMSLTRGAPGTPTAGKAIATATTATAHGLSAGQPVTISGAANSAYNIQTTILSSPAPTANAFSYVIDAGETPPTSASGGTATVGSQSWTISGIARASGNTEVAVSTTSAVTSGTGKNKVYLITAGNTVTISGSSSSDYNKTWTVKGNGGGGCSTTPNGNAADSYFCLTATVTTTPATSDSSTNIIATSSTSTVSMSLARQPSSISGSCPTAHAKATVTATTSSAHGFSNTDNVAIGCLAGSTCTAGYGTELPSVPITVTGTYTFTYSIDTSPTPCATGASMTVSSSSTIDRTNLINWVRGEDNFGDEASPGAPYTVRPSIHGDVLHSRPVVVNYGTGTGIVVFYGSNDGVYRAVNGNQTSAIGTVPAGGELWGFVAPEFFSKLNRQRNNSPALKLPTTPAGITPTPQTKDYFVDGPTGLYQRLNSSGGTDKAYIYIAMRRGGRFVYAMNVTSPTDPQVLWKKSNTDTGFSELGQTWSQPKITKVKGYANPVVIFGAGYDPAEDTEPPAGDTMGRGIFIVDAETGALVWSAKPSLGSTSCSGTSSLATCLVSGMDYSIPADITLVDRDSDGKIDRLYAVDLGGNVWRVDLEPTAGNTPDKWQVTKLAALGCDNGVCASGAVPRKFFYPADVVANGVSNGTGSYDAVLVGSGDREHPLYDTSTGSAYNVTNRFFMLKDTKTGKDGSGQATITQSALSDATNTAEDGTQVYDGTQSGYFITLDTGEKVVNAPTTVAGYTYFGTNQPTAPSGTSCTANLGIARGYRVKTLTGIYSHTNFDGGGLPPSPVSGVVGITQNGTTKYVPFLIGGGDPDCTTGDCKSPVGAQKPPITVSTKRSRTYWYKK